MIAFATATSGTLRAEVNRSPLKSLAPTGNPSTRALPLDCFFTPSSQQWHSGSARKSAVAFGPPSAFAPNLETAARFKELNDPLEERLHQLQTERVRLQAEVDVSRADTLNAEAVIEEALKLQQLWPTLDLERKRQIVQSLVESVIVDVDAKRITLRFTCLPSSEETTNIQQRLCVLMGICHHRWAVPIPKLSHHRRHIQGVSAVPKTLGEHLRLKRIDLALTQPQLAQKLAVAWQTVERWEHNYRPIRPNSRAKIVAFLGYDPDQTALKPSADQ